MPKYVEFTPGALAAFAAMPLPAGFGPVAKLVKVELFHSPGTAASTTIQEVPQNVAPTGTGESYLADPGHIQIGDATLAGEDRVGVLALMMGEVPTGTALGVVTPVGS